MTKIISMLMATFLFSFTVRAQTNSNSCPKMDGYLIARNDGSNQYYTFDGLQSYRFPNPILTGIELKNFNGHMFWVKFDGNFETNLYKQDCSIAGKMKVTQIQCDGVGEDSSLCHHNKLLDY